MSKRKPAAKSRKTTTKGKPARKSPASKSAPKKTAAKKKAVNKPSAAMASATPAVRTPKEAARDTSPQVSPQTRRRNYIILGALVLWVVLFYIVSVIRMGGH